MSEHADDHDQEEYQPPQAQDTVVKDEATEGSGQRGEASTSSETAASKPESAENDKATAAQSDNASVTPENKPEQEPKPESKAEPEHNTSSSSSKSKPVTPSKKRKVSSTTTPTPNKTRRTRANNTTTNPTTPKSLIHYLLTPSCAALVRNPDEQSHHTSHPDQLTYTTNPPLTPFAELLSALLLSRPISHNLGHRSIRTLLNPPWNYTTPAAVLRPKYTPDISDLRDGEAARLAADGGGGDAAQTVYKALEEARTQHKAKTASQLVGLAEVCAAEFCEGDEDAALSKLRQMVQDAGGEAGNVFEDAVKSKVKGVGKTGVEIARRRLQGVERWEGLGPFVDARTKGVLERMGVSGDAEQVWELVVGCVDGGDVDGVEVAGDGGEGKLKGGSDRAKWKAFVTVLERAVEADLAGKVDEVLEQAAGGRDEK